MSLRLLLLGNGRHGTDVADIISIGRTFNLAIAPSAERGQTRNCECRYDIILAVEAPESQTATELEAECASIGSEARLAKFLKAICGELTELGILWYWEYLESSRIRCSQGSVSDFVTLLSRPEGWGEAIEIGPSSVHVSYVAPLLFTITEA